MKHYAGIDVSLESSSVCVVDAEGGIVREDKVLSEPEALVAWFAAFGAPMERIGLEAGPLSQWLHAGMANAGLAVELLETRHVRAGQCQSKLGDAVTWSGYGADHGQARQSVSLFQLLA
jgi:transposase